jgi:hypothetical protein
MSRAWAYAPAASPAYDAAADAKYADTPTSVAQVLIDLAEAQWLSMRYSGIAAPPALRRGVGTTRPGQ